MKTKTIPSVAEIAAHIPGSAGAQSVVREEESSPYISSDLKDLTPRAVQIAAGIWTRPSCQNKVIDVELATEFARELDVAMRAHPSKPLEELGMQILEINSKNGWDVCCGDDWPVEGIEGEVTKVRKIGTALCLIHSEVSEALEGLRHRDRANFEEELADVLIRVFDVAAGLGIDLDKIVAAKLEKNRTRGFRHGGKAI